MNCDFCVHSGLCIYEEGARSYEKRLKEMNDKPALVEALVKCEKFRKKYNDVNFKSKTPVLPTAVDRK